MTYEEAVAQRNSLPEYRVSDKGFRMKSCVVPFNHKEASVYRIQVLINSLDVKDEMALPYSRDGQFMVQYINIVGSEIQFERV